MIDREKQRNESFTGLMGFVLQDQMITESMGRVVDRTMEHLAPSDVMITRTRRCLVKAATAYLERATNPETFAAVRGGHFVADENVDWLAAYAHELAAAPLEQHVAAEAAE